MLLGKISPVVTKTYHTGPFQTETITGEYMVVKADRYVIGVPTVEFELRFGNLEYNENGVANHFDIIMRDKINLTSEELATWGTDDAEVLHLIAAKLGTTVTETVLTDLHHHY